MEMESEANGVASIALLPCGRLRGLGSGRSLTWGGLRFCSAGEACWYNYMNARHAFLFLRPRQPWGTKTT